MLLFQAKEKGAALSIGDLLTVGEFGLRFARSRACPEFERVELGGILPQVFATHKNISALENEFGDDERRFFSNLASDLANGWCGELRLRAWIRNKASRPLRIIGINPMKKVIEPSFASAVVIQSQGSIIGDAIRFECNLDSDYPSMRRFKLEGIRRVYTSAAYYFDEGMIEVEPDHTACISILFWAGNKSYEISPQIIIDLGGAVEAVSVPMKRRGIVCSPSLIPDSEKYTRTFSPVRPFVAPNLELFNSCMRSMMPKRE